MSKIEGLSVEIRSGISIVAPVKIYAKLWKLLQQCHICDLRYNPDPGAYNQLLVASHIKEAKLGTFEVYSEEEFDRLQNPPLELQNYYVTYPVGSNLGQNYSVVRTTSLLEARSIVTASIEDRFAFIYNEEEKVKCIDPFNLTEVPLQLYEYV